MNVFRRSSLVSFVFAMLLFALILASAPAASAYGQNITRDIPYLNGAQQQESGDLYVPAGEGPFPAIVLLHGGSWRSGNKGDFRKLATDLAGRGYAGFSIDYDLSPKSFPISWEQAQAAVRFLRRHAAQYHIDPNRIMIAGTSAGGEIAALVALAPQGPAQPAALPGLSPDDTSDAVSAALILNGVYSLASQVHVITRYLGGSCRSLKATCEDASPLQHVHPGAPPIFVGHGMSDHLVPYYSAQVFTTALREDHDAVTLYSVKGGHHSYWVKDKFYAPNLAAMETFLASVEHPAPAAP